jgi:hypothetical protein
VRPEVGGNGQKVSVAVVWENTGLDGDIDIYFDKSTNGTAWNVDLQVNEDAAVPQRQKEPEVALDADGAIVVVWSDYRNEEWDIYFTNCYDDGQTFKTNMIANNDSTSAVQDKRRFIRARMASSCA